MDIFNKKRVKELEDNIWQLKRDIETREAEHKENADLKLKLSQANTEISSLKEKIRTQTETDIYFECEKIKHKLINGKTKKDVEPNYQNLAMFQSQLAQYPTSQSVLSQLGQTFGSGLF